MDIKFLNKLREESEYGIQIILDELEKQSSKFGIDKFNGHNRDEFILKFDSYNLVIDGKGEKERIHVRIGIYLEDTENIWAENLEPIGNYTTIFDINGEFIDEFITIDSKYQNFGIDYWIEILKNSIPKSYFKRNIPEFTLVTYINHSIFLFQSRDFLGTFVFLKRCLEYLEIQENKDHIESEYLKNVIEYIQSLFYYLKNNKLIDNDKLTKYNIKERIQMMHRT